ncbi:MAG TPA: protein-tyrosine phosphatase family protein [Candidatus Thermoplasmatota archaeon]|nr:protein-tyrosine phosphatase family protein [Candidatus Thermoplasmatota archaeon]
MWFDDLGGLVHVEGNLWRSPIPQTRAHVEAYRRAGIRRVVSLEEEVDPALVAGAGLAWSPHFWTDNAPPTRPQMARLVDELATLGDAPVVVHCKAGWGRTGTAVACALVERGWSASDALLHFWRRVRGSESLMRRTGQMEFVHGWAAAKRGRGLL